MTPADSTSFNLLGTLPTGRVAIEASAGTGKTFTLAALATRYLAEQDITPSDLLIVTFTRAATAELRSRIREQLVEAAAALSSDEPEGSALTRHLASADREPRRRRLEQAVADFDAASISTIHGFAAQVRRTLGLSSAIDPDARLDAGSDDLVEAACADALAAASVRSIPPGDFPLLKTLVEATKKKLGGPDLVLVPDGTDDDVDASFVLVRDLVVDAVTRLQSRRRSEGTIGFDDVLIELRDELASSSAAAAIEALQSRYRVVLIDEFQDTDRVQWEIFSRLFGALHSGTSLILVGDPKQAIYRFRGADISVYLDAVRDKSLSGLSTLTTNWRADGACVNGLNALFDGATFGDPSIRYVPVEPSEANRFRRMEDRSMPDSVGSMLSGLDLRIAPKSELPTGGNGKPDSDAVYRMIEDDVAAHVRDLLDRARIPDPAEDPEHRDLEPSDVAVLVTSWSQAERIQRAFARQGIPAVVAGSGSVLESEAAMQVRYLLDAMERPGDLRRVRTYSLSWFEQWSIDRVAGADDRSLAVLQDRLTNWSTRLADRPVVEVLAQVWRESSVMANVLGLADGDRNVTDLDHVAELLHARAPQGRSSVAGLIALLEPPPEGEADAESDSDITARRIESEARKVLITTVWGAKGLEFPVVCVPMLWRSKKSRDALVFTDPRTGERMLDVTLNGEWPTKKALQARRDIAGREEAAERLRILYVALTRARHHTAVWWAGTADSTNALTRLLFARDIDGTLRPGDLDPDGSKNSKVTVPPDPVAAMAPLVEVSDGAFRVSSVSERSSPATRWSTGATDAVQQAFGVSTLDRHFDRSINRWSFTSITRHAVDDFVDPFDTSESDRGAADESGAEDAQTTMPDRFDNGFDDRSASTGSDADPVASLGPLMAGTTFGTFVHGIFEKVDFRSPTLESDIERLARDSARWAGVDLATLAPEGLDGTELLVNGLQAAIRSPLGPLFSGGTLASIDRSDRIDELAFDLRIGRVDGHPSAGDIGRLVVDSLPGGHVLVPWAEALAGGSIDVELGGYLTGSIDLVARIHRPDGSDGFVVADYKTNRLTRRGEPQRSGDYGPEALADAMVEHHYPLQALLYAAALHRYLRWKKPTTGRTTLVSGASYLFVRGMTGPGVATTAGGDPHGVFTWDLPSELVTGLSDLLDGRGASLAGR
jgi:exodeoxyribonuclease V beta subunit